MGNQPMVLIARLDDGRTLYAVEREDRGLYVLCQLGSWVSLQQLKAAAIVSRQDLSNKAFEKAISSGSNVGVAVITSGASKYNKKKRLAITALQSMVKRPSTGLSKSQIEITRLETRQEQINNQVEPVFQEQPAGEFPLEDVAPQLSAAEMFDNIRKQYLEALYLSKVILAQHAIL